MRPIDRKGGDGCAQRGRSLISTTALFILMLLYDSSNVVVSGVTVNFWTVTDGAKKLRVLHCSSWSVLNARFTSALSC